MTAKVTFAFKAAVVARYWREEDSHTHTHMNELMQPTRWPHAAG